MLGALCIALWYTYSRLPTAGPLWQGRYVWCLVLGVVLLAGVALEERRLRAGKRLGLVFGIPCLLVMHLRSLQFVHDFEQSRRVQPTDRSPGMDHPAPRSARAAGDGTGVWGLAIEAVRRSDLDQAESEIRGDPPRPHGRAPRSLSWWRDEPPMSRIHGTPEDGAPRIDESKVSDFFQRRAARIPELGPTRAVIYQDHHPDLAERRDQHERSVLTPLLRLDGSQRLLDVGCGTGRWTATLGGLVSHYHGLDFAAGLVEHARAEHGDPPHTVFSVADASDFSLAQPQEDQPFDGRWSRGSSSTSTTTRSSPP